MFNFMFIYASIIQASYLSEFPKSYLIEMMKVSVSSKSLTKFLLVALNED